MKNALLAPLIIVFLAASCSGGLNTPAEDSAVSQTTSSSTSVNRPFPQHTEYVEGSILPSHRSQEQLDQDVRDFYDYWKATYVMDAGTDDAGNQLFRITFGKEIKQAKSTVSEGQGYGMVIVAVMAGHDPDAQMIFNGLWRFVRAHPSEVDPRLMDWKVPESEYGNDSAFDGDTDIAFGLLLADAQWGSDGEIDYKTEAVKLITAIRESTIGSDSMLPMLGDWVGEGDETYNQYTPRSSDFMLVNFRAFGAATEDEVWLEVVANSQQVMSDLQHNYSPNTGLIPDFIVLTGEGHVPQPAPPEFLEASTDGQYSYNAGRVPWRVGSDALLFEDAVSTGITTRISGWAEAAAGGDPYAIKAGYDLDGTPLPDSDYFTTFFAAPLGVAAMLNPDQQQWLNNIYDSVYNTHEDYYEDSVTLLCLITMSGNMWVP
jgi:endo-1,4-beta-D-glucanase Y